jgi:NTP pyrophosphatase (non-canonical NTP hydrolase)
MKIEQYKELSERTLSKNFHMEDQSKKDMLHAAIGLSTEANEILDHFKKVVFYGKEIDPVNLSEEIGDLMWYIAIFLRELDLDFESILDTNIKKLYARYGEKFSKDAALIRDLRIEREILEKGVIK